MKLQFKLIAAALVLAAAGSASAQVSTPTSANGSDILFYAFDNTTKNAFEMDLGPAYTNFLPGSAAAGTSFTDNIAASAAWAQYVAAEGGTTANTTWGVVGGDKNAGAYGLLTTSTAGTDPSAVTSLGNIRGAIGTPLFNLFNGLNLVTNTAALTAGYFTNSTTGENIGNNFQNNGGIKLGFTTDNAIGTASQFNAFDVATGLVTSKPAATVYGNANGNATFNFDGTTLSYNVPSIVAAVPEPSTYLMMLIGMMLVTGAVIRRRDSK